jgi:hypothetical protein
MRSRARVFGVDSDALMIVLAGAALVLYLYAQRVKANEAKTATDAGPLVIPYELRVMQEYLRDEYGAGDWFTQGFAPLPSTVYGEGTPGRGFGGGGGAGW